MASSRPGLCRTSHLLPGSPPVSRWSPAKTHPSFTVEDRSSPARRFEEFGSTWCISLEAAHPAGEHVFCSPSRWRTCVLQPTPRRTIGSRPIFSGNAGSVVPPIRRPHVLLLPPHFTNHSRGCVPTLIYGACVFSSGELEHISKMCTYVYVRTCVSIYVRRYVRT